MIPTTTDDLDITSDDARVTFYESTCPIASEDLPLADSISVADLRSAWNGLVQDGWTGRCANLGFDDDERWDIGDEPLRAIGSTGSAYDIVEVDGLIDRIDFSLGSTDANSDSQRIIEDALEALLGITQWDQSTCPEGFNGPVGLSESDTGGHTVSVLYCP